MERTLESSEDEGDESGWETLDELLRESGISGGEIVLGFSGTGGLCAALPDKLIWIVAVFRN